jgi:hypothetical protein
MVTTIEQITGIEHGGIYFTDQITGVAGEGTLTLEISGNCIPWF